MNIIHSRLTTKYTSPGLLDIQAVHSFLCMLFICMYVIHIQYLKLVWYIWLAAKNKASLHLYNSLINIGNRTEWSPKKIGRQCSGSPICLSLVWLQTKLDDTKSYYQLIITITISKKRRIAKLWQKGEIWIKRLNKEGVNCLMSLSNWDWLI